ncbi:MAG: class II aldolase/adducin family protein [Coriobacteriia bacterium]|nr:class II aldolase/adducin family protein [Coriobacteriia bacterium]
MFDQFEWVGRDLYTSGAVSSHGGNMSVRLDDERMLITRTGSMIGRLTPADIIETSAIACGDARDGDCSVELVVHRAIYAATGARAIVHAHAIQTVARSFVDDVIVPPDSESKFRLGDVPVIVAAETIGSADAGALLAAALVDRRVAVLRSHGPFARGESLEDAYQAISCLEASCAVLNVLDAIGRPLR